MKSTFYRKILDETTLEVDDSPEGSIEKLRQLQGVCRATCFDGEPIEFLCTQKRKISVTSTATKRGIKIKYNRSTYVLGEVTVENNKTVLKIYTVYDRFRYFVRLFCIGLSAVVGIFALLSAQPVVSVIGLLAAVVLLISLCVSACVSATSEKQTMQTDFEIMKAEVANRVQSIADWEK